jgi:predicted negative regulator of RcsB-dependent stress response
MADWLQLHAKEGTWGVIALAVVVAGGWFYIRSNALKTERAGQAYSEAQQAAASGNLPLAESDLRRVTTRYAGTAAANQAQLTLAQMLYDQGKFEDGVAVLQKASQSLEGSKDFASSGHLLLADGYEQLKKFDDAAREYGAAAKTARFDTDRQRYESSQAQALLFAGKVDQAKQIWTTLAADSKGVVAGEARLRLGELNAQPAPKT